MKFLPSTICPKLTPCGSLLLNRFATLSFCLSLLLVSPYLLRADEFTFDLDEIEKSPFESGGFIELQWEHMDINEDSLFGSLSLRESPGSSYDRLKGSFQFDGSYSKELYSAHWLLKMSMLKDDFGYYDSVDLFTAYVNFQPLPAATLAVGKKPYKWGKGYAWNPVGYINRRKDPNNPEESLEGYITAEADFIRSFTGKLQTAALTAVFLPVYDSINDDFGREQDSNFGAKLYFLFMDTDVDFLALLGESKPDSYGFDFAKNISSNFEVHGELSWVDDGRKIVLADDGNLHTVEEDTLSWLLGIRYLTPFDLTAIVEYYHNGLGYSKSEMDTFFQFTQDASVLFQQTASRLLYDRAVDASLKGYGKPQPGRDYLYARFSQKEPFDILYFTPSLTTIINLSDKSFSITPELNYTGITNWELKLRLSYLHGGSFTEYGEKQNSVKYEIRLRYYF